MENVRNPDRLADIMTASNGLPAWARESFRDFIVARLDSVQILELNIRGVDRARYAVEEHEALRNLHLAIARLDARDDPSASDVPATDDHPTERLVRLAEFANQEAANGYQKIFGQAAVMLWSQIEVFVSDLIRSWLRHVDLATVAGTDRVRVPLLGYQNWSEHEQADHLMKELRDQRGSSENDRVGTGAFERLLRIVDLSDGIPDETARSLLELSQIRHVLVHRGGRVDGTLVKRCPWLGFVEHDRVRLSREMYWRWHNSGNDYVSSVQERVVRRFETDSVQISSRTI